MRGTSGYDELPEVYDEKYKRWSLNTLPFLPKEFLYEVIPGVAKQFRIVQGVLTREDVDCIYGLHRLRKRRRIYLSSC